MSGTQKPVEQEQDKLKHVPRRIFPKSSRILRAADFRSVYDRGIRVSSPLFAAFCLARNEASDSPRLGLTVPKVVGKAVDRNRIKRRLREAFRLQSSRLDPKWDIVLNPRRSLLSAPFEQIERALLRVIDTCNSKG